MSFPIEGADTCACPKGPLPLWFLHASLGVSQVKGSLGREVALRLETAIRSKIAGGHRHLGFHDWFDMTGHDDDAQSGLVAFARDIRTSFDGAHILLRPPVVAFGVRTANLVVRPLSAYADRASFERALREALRARGVAGASGLS